MTDLPQTVADKLRELGYEVTETEWVLEYDEVEEDADKE